MGGHVGGQRNQRAFQDPAPGPRARRVVVPDDGSGLGASAFQAITRDGLGALIL